MHDAPDPDWYFDNVLAYAEPGRRDPAARGPAMRWQQWWRRRWLDAGDEPGAALARDQGFVVSTAQLRDIGWLDHDLRREVRRGRWTVPARGVATPVVASAAQDPVARRRRHALTCSAAALQRPGQVISGPSAAILHGLPTFEVPNRPQLTGPATVTLGRQPRAHVRSATLSAADTTNWFGAPVTTVARTLVDLARHDRRDALMAADAALRESLIDTAALDASLAEACGWPGVRQARAVLALADPLAESALESLVRLALHDDGFRPPELQVEIADPQCGTRYRVDMLWPQPRLIIEADGRVKYTGDELWREKRRESRLRALGYRIERILWRDAVRDWPETRARLWAALAV